MQATIEHKTIAKIEALKKLVAQKGLIKDQVIKELQELRPDFIQQKEPLVTRVIRQTYEYIEHYGVFNLNLLAEEDEDGNIEEEIDLEGEDSFTEIKENFLYLLDLFAHPENQRNKEELTRVKELYLDRDVF